MNHDRFGDGYQPPVWDSWSDPPEAFPQPEGEATETWSLQDDDTQPGDEVTEPDLGQQVPFADGPDTRRTERHTRELRVGPGVVVQARYRLEEELTVRYGTHSWRAFDQKLSRPVMLHLLDQNTERNTTVLKAARSAAAATDSRFLRVLDAVRGDEILDGNGQRLEGVGAYIVCEFVPGTSLEHLLATGPLSGLEAAWVTRELADALAPLHAQGLYHQQLNPDTVVVTATGNIKIVGFLTEEAMFPLRSDEDLPPEQSDVRAIGQLLYASLVNRWPAPQSEAGRRHWGMVAAPMDGHGWLTPRQLRAGVSPALDVVCDQVLNLTPRTGASHIDNASALNSALSRVLGTADAAADLEHRVRYPTVPLEPSRPVVSITPSQVTGAYLPAPVESPAAAAHLQAPLPTPEPGEDESPETWADRNPPRRWLQVLVGLVAITLFGSLIAVAVNGGGKAEPDPPHRSSSNAAPAGPKKLAIANVTDFDPESDGGNGEELAKDVAKAWDGRPGTAWTTMRYQNNPKLGGLKPGVGLVVDLGKPVDVGRVVVILQGKPTAVQLRVPAKDPGGATPPMDAADSWTIVARNDAAPESLTLMPAKVAKTRYLLLYLTSLPNVGGSNYRAAIAEIEVFDQ